MVEDDQVLTVGDKLMWVTIVEGQELLVRVVSPERGLAQRLVGHISPFPNAHHLYKKRERKKNLRIGIHVHFTCNLLALMVAMY